MAVDTSRWRRRRWRITWRVLLPAWAVLLLGSHATILLTSTPLSPPPSATVTVPEAAADGTAPDGRPIELALRWWRSGEPDAPLALLIHGSPGESMNFVTLAPALNALGMDALAVDLPGFGHSEPWVGDYSARAAARTCLTLLERLRERGEAPRRVHVVGWSNGGAVALHMDDIARSRGANPLASVTLLAATGAQRTEGSGDFYFERAKYLLGYATLVAGAELTPHFGLLGPRSFRHGFIRSFLDSDQRPLAGVLRTMRTPLLILHGREDFLVAPWAARAHHELASASTLVMTGGGHFMPFLSPEATAAHIAALVRRHEDPAARAIGGSVELDPPRGGRPVLGALDSAGRWLRSRHWVVEAVVVAALALLSWRLGLVLAAWLVAGMHVDFGVASVGLAAALAVRGPGVWRRAAALPAAILALTPAWMLVRFGGWWAIERYGLAALLATLALTAALTWTLPRIWTRAGRQRLRAAFWRWISHEFWPSWLNYALLTPTFVRQTIRHRHPLLFTATNPGMGSGGGLVGEDKAAIIRALRAADAPVLAGEVVPANEDLDARVRAADDLLRERADLGGYPVVCKPNAGERGRAVRVVRSRAELGEQLARVPAPVLLQRYDPAPREVGVFWIRLRPPGDADATGREGMLFAITRKVFPAITGDGVRTLRELVLADQRFRVQEPVFAARFGRSMDLVPPAGERIRLGLTGNHAQGCRFEDGADLITDALADAFDRVCRRYPMPDGSPGGLDIGRFDVRYHEDDELRAGRGFSIVELNGSSAEATNVYDPSKTWWWALTVMSRQWEHAYRLGAMRRSMGERPMSPADVARLIGWAWRRRPADTLAD